MNSDESQLLRDIRDEVQEIRRGLYGDPVNKVRGLVQRQEEDEVRIDKLEEFRKRIIWVWGIVVTAVVALWELVGDHIKGLFK